MSSAELTELHVNWAAWLHFTADHAPEGASASFGAIRCSSVGVPMPLFNQAFAFEEPAVGDLVRATRWFADRSVPFWVTAPDSVAPAIVDMAERAGLDPAATTMPGMTLARLVDLAPVAGGVGEIREIAEPDQLDDFSRVASDVFGAPPEASAVLSPASTLEDDRCRWFVAHVDGDAAACGQLFRTDDVAGVYAIAVREPYRHRGLGEAVTAEVLAVGRNAGCSRGVLQASPMGEPVYDRMGFETFTHYHRFAPA